MAARRHEDIRRLDVAMDDSLRVRGFQCVGHLNGDVQQPAERHRLFGNHLLEGLAFQQLHDDEVLAIMLADVMDRTDGRVIQGRGSSSLPLESLQCLRVAGEIGGKKLQRDGSAESRVFGVVHDSHPALAELREHAIVRDGGADHQ